MLGYGILIAECESFFLPAVLVDNKTKGLSLGCTGYIASLFFLAPVRNAVYLQQLKAEKSITILVKFTRIHIAFKYAFCTFFFFFLL